MITRLKITDFKAHQDTDLSLGALTLLTGINSSGKSSILQSLLLLRQSYKKGRLSNGLDLNAPLCDIGKGIDALCRFSQKEIISFHLDTKLGPFSFNFDARDRYEDTFIPAVKRISIASLKKLPLFTNHFQYLSSSRLANLNSYPIDTYAVEEEQQLSLEYGQGELVAHFLEYYGNSKFSEIELSNVLHPSTDSKNLLEQTIAWEQEISPRLTILPVKKQDKITLEYGYKGEGDTPPLNNLQAKNVGYGISYSLSVVVALLAARPGSLLLIENPEAHLHPKGQSKLAELIALAAQSGVQVIIETHSDHIFNGIRKAIAAKIVEKSNVKVHYFELDEKNVSINTEIEFSDNGRILKYKKGLFDQFDDDLDELLGF